MCSWLFQCKLSLRNITLHQCNTLLGNRLAWALLKVALVRGTTNKVLSCAYHAKSSSPPSLIKHDRPSIAMIWYSRAADAGDGDALVLLGQLYENGDGVTQDEKTTVELYSRAVAIQHPDGLLHLSFCYQVGCGVAADEKQGILSHVMINWMLRCY
jgi:TPR repeat protein